MMLRPGVYRGFVEDVVDPEQRARVRVRIPSIHADTPTALLPWAERVFPDGGGAYGSYTPLKAATHPGNHGRNDGDVVFVMFEGGDASLPVVTGLWRRTGTMPAQALEEEGHARRVLMISRHGTRLELGDKQSDFEFKITMPGGNVLHMRESPGGRGIHITSADGNTLSLQDEEPGEAAPDTKNDYDETPDRQHVVSQTSARATRVMPVPAEKSPDGTVQSGTDGLPDVLGVRGILLRTPSGHSIQMRDITNPGIFIQTNKGHKINVSDVDDSILLETVKGHRLIISDPDNRVAVSTVGGNTGVFQDGTGVHLTSQWGQSIFMSVDDFGMEWPAQDMYLRFGGGENRWKIVGDLRIDATGVIEFVSGGDMNLEAGGVQYCIGAGGRVESPQVPSSW